MENIIKIEDLIFEYKSDENGEDVSAITDVSIDVKKGEFVAIIGRNGSGKSTLAKNINALLLPTGGAVYVKGWDTKDESKIWDIRQAAGMVFQNPDNQLVSAIVEDDVAFGPENLSVDPKEIRKRVDEALEGVNMYEHRKKAPHLLSGGQKQRIAIAGVVAMRPECIVLDEPTAMLDPKGRQEVMDIIKKLNRDGITIVLITHFMEEAAEAGRVIIMSNGQIAMEGQPQDIFKNIDALKSLNLNVPVAVELCHRLKNRGINIPDNIVNNKEMVEFICQYK